MSNKIKVVGLALVAVMAFSALTAAAAQAGAPRWTTEAGTLGTGATKVATGTGEEATANTLAVPTLPLTLETKGDNCTISGNIIGTAANTPGTMTGKLHCTEVKVKENAACVVKSSGAGVANGTVSTNNLTGTLVWLEEKGTKKVGVTFAPETVGQNFVSIVVSGCALAETYAVTGNVIGRVSTPEGGVDATEGTLLFDGAANPAYWDNATPTRAKKEDAGLKFGAKAATFMGAFTIKLNPCEKWGIFNG